ncbi:hypothetical protein LOK49_LG01G01064 [Camellia lanceoleosa]|uniref:Uncharacterized protein n=1 Tax=Camellia lanceoleosa TaxID=1840588 RepID=A0ACC0J0Z5_9ERIC|nr:hypothetical protein LOK49_LG01G01064 [Camellia lanceoleosa]
MQSSLLFLARWSEASFVVPLIYTSLSLSLSLSLSSLVVEMAKAIIAQGGGGGDSNDQPNQPHSDVKLFNLWSFDDVQTTDISVMDYIAVSTANHATYVPHTAGRYSVERFRKAQCPIV